jgi:2Fe-2S ferredoxin
VSDSPIPAPDASRSLRRLSQEPASGTSRTFRVTFLPMDVTVEAGPVDELAHHEGRPGSILDIADRHEIAIDHACGGFAACSTCHVYVKQGLETCNEISDDEADMLDEAPLLKPSSRLSCQCIPDGSSDVVVEIPPWNRNLAKEGKR